MTSTPDRERLAFALALAVIRARRAGREGHDVDPREFAEHDEAMRFALLGSRAAPPAAIGHVGGPAQQQRAAGLLFLAATTADSPRNVDRAAAAVHAACALAPDTADAALAQLSTSLCRFVLEHAASSRAAPVAAAGALLRLAGWRGGVGGGNSDGAGAGAGAAAALATAQRAVVAAVRAVAAALSAPRRERTLEFYENAGFLTGVLPPLAKLSHAPALTGARVPVARALRALLAAWSGPEEAMTGADRLVGGHVWGAAGSL